MTILPWVWNPFSVVVSDQGRILSVGWEGEGDEELFISHTPHFFKKLEDENYH